MPTAWILSLACGPVRYRRLCPVLLCVLSLLGASSRAQSGDRVLDRARRVLAAVYPSDVGQRPYFLRLVVRYSDSASQIVVVEYPDPRQYWITRCSITTYELADMTPRQVGDLITRMERANPDVTARPGHSR